MTDPKLIETVARGMCERESGRQWCSACHPSQPCTGYLYMSKARSALAAINASGTHWVAPHTLTEEMAIAAEGGSAHFVSITIIGNIWQWMRTAYLAKTEEGK